MLPLFAIIKLILETYAVALFGWLKYPGMIYYPIMIALVMAIVFHQYRRQAKMEEHLFGAPFSQPLRQTLISLGYGALGGILASFLMMTLGIPLSEDLGLIYVWPVILVLMLINPRFMCFAYGGGIIGTLSLGLRGLAQLIPGLGELGLVNNLISIDLPALMALVGLLHLAESFLILISGHSSASPVIVQGPRGKRVGGFMLQRFWPMPMVALLVEAISKSSEITDSIAMPGWWPLLTPALQPGPGMILMFSVFPIVAALGYSDFAVSTPPRNKGRRSARNLLFYSLVLIALSILAGHWRFLQILPVLFAPLAHEYLIQVSNRREWAGQPLFAPLERGVKLLAVLPGSPAQEQGLASGWVIVSVNGWEVNNRREFTHALHQFPGLADLEVLSPAGTVSTVHIHQRQGKLGLIPVPDETEQGPFLQLLDKGWLSRLWQRRKNKQ